MDDSFPIKDRWSARGQARIADAANADDSTGPCQTGKLSLTGWSRGAHQLVCHYRIDDLSFSTAYWYGDCNLYELEQRYGAALLQAVYFHIAAFDINKLASLRPERLDWGPGAEFVTPAFTELWRAVFQNVWARWRFEHDDPDYHGPAFRPAATALPATPVQAVRGDVDLLAFCGGGKDSLVAMKLLDRGGLAFDSLSYANSCYGLGEIQHALADALLDHTGVRHRRRQWIMDDFLNAPVRQLGPQREIRQLTAAETPGSIFAALPYALQHGYRYLALGHERSADTGQLLWDRTGEHVNYQWGKSYAAERLINEYVRTQLVGNVHCFSILKPVYDVMIFNLLREDLDAVPATHSCNVQKPWCKRCPKCAYVWLQYMAWLPVDLVDSMFGGVNLLEVDDNRQTFMQLIGAADRLPFECIGQADESRLAFEMCRRKGLRGAAMDRYLELGLGVNSEALLDRYLRFDREPSGLPEFVWTATQPQMQKAATDARRYAAGILESGQSG